MRRKRRNPTRRRWHNRASGSQPSRAAAEARDGSSEHHVIAAVGEQMRRRARCARDEAPAAGACGSEQWPPISITLPGRDTMTPANDAQQAQLGRRPQWARHGNRARIGTVRSASAMATMVMPDERHEGAHDRGRSVFRQAKACSPGPLKCPSGRSRGACKKFEVLAAACGSTWMRARSSRGVTMFSPTPRLRPRPARRSSNTDR